MRSTLLKQCPICESNAVKSGCKPSSKHDEAILCRKLVDGRDGPSGWHLGKTVEGGGSEWGLWFPGEKPARSQVSQFRNYRPAAAEAPKNSTPIADRSLAYAELIEAMPVLSMAHIEGLQRRGLTEAQIETLYQAGVRTWVSALTISADTAGVAGFSPDGKTIYRQGFAIPMYALNGAVQGFQIANDNKGEYSKYSALSSSDPTKTAAWNLPNNESPLNILRVAGAAISEILLVDGALKSHILFSQLLSLGITDRCVIGSPGASASSAPL